MTSPLQVRVTLYSVLRGNGFKHQYGHWKCEKFQQPFLRDPMLVSLIVFFSILHSIPSFHELSTLMSCFYVFWTTLGDMKVPRD